MRRTSAATHAATFNQELFFLLSVVGWWGGRTPPSTGEKRCFFASASLASQTALNDQACNIAPHPVVRVDTANSVAGNFIPT